MFTAKDVDKIIRERNECNGLDVWIENHLVKQFINTPGKATVATNVVKSNGWTNMGFVESMSLRGFSVVVTSDQRDGDFYTITYPPQEL